MKRTDLPINLDQPCHAPAQARLRACPRPVARRTAASVFRRCQRRVRPPMVAALLLCSGAAGVLPAPFANAQAPAPAPVASAAAQDEGVNINTASADELAERLNGVGASRALAIVRYREQFGPFESVEELAEVGGIGMATIERNRALIRLR